VSGKPPVRARFASAPSVGVRPVRPVRPVHRQSMDKFMDKRTAPFGGAVWPPWDDWLGSHVVRRHSLMTGNRRHVRLRRGSSAYPTVQDTASLAKPPRPNESVAEPV